MISAHAVMWLAKWQPELAVEERSPNHYLTGADHAEILSFRLEASRLGPFAQCGVALGFSYTLDRLSRTIPVRFVSAPTLYNR